MFSEMSAVLMHREKEFLTFLCEPLEDLDDNVAEECIEILADQIRVKVFSENIFYDFHNCVSLIVDRCFTK